MGFSGSGYKGPDRLHLANSHLTMKKGLIEDTETVETVVFRTLLDSKVFHLIE